MKRNWQDYREADYESRQRGYTLEQPARTKPLHTPWLKEPVDKTTPEEYDAVVQNAQGDLGWRLPKDTSYRAEAEALMKQYVSYRLQQGETKQTVESTIKHLQEEPDRAAITAIIKRVLGVADRHITERGLSEDVTAEAAR